MYKRQLSILLSHEFGHFIAARIHKVDASLPYFIPLPFLSPFGTMGAVIRMRSVIPTRRALLDIGAAGPLAGLALAPVSYTHLCRACSARSWSAPDTRAISRASAIGTGIRSGMAARGMSKRPKKIATPTGTSPRVSARRSSAFREGRSFEVTQRCYTLSLIHI